MLINKHEGVDLKDYSDSEAFIEYSNDMDDTSKNLKEHNPNKERKIMIEFDDVIAYILCNKRTLTNSSKIIILL